MEKERNAKDLFYLNKKHVNKTLESKRKKNRIRVASFL